MSPVQDTVQAKRAVRLALEDLHQGTLREILSRAQSYRAELSDRVAYRVLTRMVRMKEVELTAGVYLNKGPRPARRPRGSQDDEEDDR